MDHFYRCILSIVLSVSSVVLVVPKCYDLRNLPTTKGSLLKNWCFYNETNQSLSGCYKLCTRYTACRSVNYIRDNLTCNLNLKTKHDFPEDVIRNDNTYYINKGDLDQIFSSPCSTANCKWSEMCVERKYGGTDCVNRTGCVYSKTTSVLRKESGFLQSINYPKMYPANSEQEFLIIGPVGTYISLTFVAFQTEAGYDFLTVREGCNQNSLQLLKISGDSQPDNLRILHNRAWIHFHSDYIVHKTGFQINYTIN